MLKAVIIDSNAMSRGLLNTVLTDGGYSVAGQTHTSAQGYALLQKYHPHIVCIALEQVEDGNQVVEQIRENMPKTLIFMVSGAIDAATLQATLARGVHGFIVKPFKADAVLKTIKNTVLAMIKKQQG
ncbi:MAG TPA: response regulator [Telluria sp.]|nr:response regulator [Telluria sp.]